MAKYTLGIDAKTIGQVSITGSLLGILTLASPAHADMSVAQACEEATRDAMPIHALQEPSAEGEVILFSNQVDYHEANHLSLQGDVEIVRGDVQVFSEQAEVNQNTQTAELTGGVRVEGPNIQIKGAAAKINLETKESHVQDAEFISGITRIRGKAKQIHVPTPDKLNIEDGFFTTCRPGEEAWSFASSDIRLDDETGQGVATHTRFQIYDVPVLYVPWFTFAIDDRRTSGFLYPEFGTSNTGQGLFLTTPYYFNIAPHKDMTYTPSKINGRGLHHELEGRYLSQLGQSTVAVGYISKDDDFVSEQTSAGHEEDGQRWGFSLEQDITFDTEYGQWLGHIDYSAVSDDDYLGDLNQGLQIDRQDYLDRRAELALNYDTWHFKGLVQAYEILDDETLEEERPYQRLPELSFVMNQHFNAFHLNWQSDYVYFYRDNHDLATDEQTYGSRFHHRPRIALPIQKTWGYVTPTLSVDHTDYWLRSYAPQDNHLSRSVAVTELDSGIYLDRFNDWGNTTIRHSIEPRLYYVNSHYLQSDESAQNQFPNFDSELPLFSFDRLFEPDRYIGGDRVGDEERYTLGLNSRWSNLNVGRDFASLKLAYIHYLADTKVNLEGESPILKGDKQYAAELNISPFESFDISTSALWDDRRKEVLETYSKLAFRSEDYGHVVNLGHRYRDGGFGQEGVEQADSSFITPLNQKISLLGRWRYELNSHRTIGTLAGLEYRSCCWRLQVFGQRYLSDESEIENGVLLRFQLIGLGSYGENSSTLDDQIPGYARRETYLH